MGKPVHEVAHIINRVNARLPVIVPNTWKQRTLYALSRCRTAGMGGHIDRCDNPECNKLHISYNSCRNRHCPKCQGHLREQWIANREAELINTPYFHVVFTLPSDLNPQALAQPKLIYSLLFATAWGVIRDFGANPKMLGAKTGMIAILHTWGQNLSLHPHLHCIVPAGGLTVCGRWKATRSKGRFLFPVKAMGKVFRTRFVEGLRKETTLSVELSGKLFAKPWVIYAKRPFFGPRQVIEYLGRYTHKIAISNQRITDVTKGSVTFRVKDYRKGGKTTDCTLSHGEFIRRFAQHILPKRLVRIRHYGILSSTGKKKYLETIREQTGPVELPEKRPALQAGHCPSCKTGSLVTIATFTRGRAPPQYLLDQIL